MTRLTKLYYLGGMNHDYATLGLALPLGAPLGPWGDGRCDPAFSRFPRRQWCL